MQNKIRAKQSTKLKSLIRWEYICFQSFFRVDGSNIEADAYIYFFI